MSAKYYSLLYKDAFIGEVDAWVVDTMDDIDYDRQNGRATTLESFESAEKGYQVLKAHFDTIADIIRDSYQDEELIGEMAVKLAESHLAVIQYLFEKEESDVQKL